MNKAFSTTFGIIGGFVAWAAIALAVGVAGLVVVAAVLKEPPAPPEPPHNCPANIMQMDPNHFDPACLEGTR